MRVGHSSTLHEVISNLTVSYFDEFVLVELHIRISHSLSCSRAIDSLLTHQAHKV